MVAIPRGAERVTLRLQLETDDYKIFWVALRDLATARVVWRSGDLVSEGNPGERIVTFTAPADVFASQRYSVDLTAMSPTGSPELIAYYPIRVGLE